MSSGLSYSIFCFLKCSFFFHTFYTPTIVKFQTVKYSGYLNECNGKAPAVIDLGLIPGREHVVASHQLLLELLAAFTEKVDHQPVVGSQDH